MRYRYWTTSEIRYIRRNANRMTDRSMAEKLGVRITQWSSYRKHLGIFKNQKTVKKLQEKTRAKANK